MPYDYLVLAGIALGYIILATITGAIVLYLMVRLENQKLIDQCDYCPDCGGTRFDKWWTPCQRCRMTGYVPKEAIHR